MSMISDLVDRLRIESKSMGKYGVDYMATLLMQSADVIDMLSKKARATEQGWIPCSERMPKEEKATYLVCTDSECMCSCRWTNTNPIWTDLTTEWHWCIFDIPQYSKVVAWMPLKPWKGADDE